MGKFIKGEVVVVPFPFTDLSTAKRRPALVLAELQGDDVVLCQITSNSLRDTYALQLDIVDFEKGSLSKLSNIRPNRLVTVDKNIILYSVGKIKNSKMQIVYLLNKPLAY